MKEPSATPSPGPEQQGEQVLDRFRGCLLGGAVGDALGAPIEFMSRNQILEAFGPDGITSYANAYGGIGKITDDTQMTLFTAEGLLRAWVCLRYRGITSYTGVTANAYLHWLETQGQTPINDVKFDGAEPGWLIQQPELHHRRAPGNTCLSALQSMPALGEPASNNSKGCGGVMRVAPVGLFAWRLNAGNNPQEAFQLATELAALTHGHPTGSLTAGVLAVLIQGLADGAQLPEVLPVARGILQKQQYHEETLVAIERAEELAASDVAADQSIARLGQGWVAEEALAIALYCALVARDFRHGIILAVNHDGDSDSTGAITGNLLGTQYGAKAIPEEWLTGLELREAITEITNDLYAFRDWDIGEHAEDQTFSREIWGRYPGY